MSSSPIDQDFVKLKRRVQKLGGKGTFQVITHLQSEVWPAFEALLLKHATVAGKPDVVMKRARSRDCHRNAAAYVVKHEAVMWSGFALSEGIWRVHSWCVKDGKLIETTTFAHEKYVGIALDTVERCEAFMEGT